MRLASLCRSAESCTLTSAAEALWIWGCLLRLETCDQLIGVQPLSFVPTASAPSPARALQYAYSSSCFRPVTACVRQLLYSALCLRSGTAMVTFVDNQSGGAAPNSVLGDLLCLLSACFYASYTIAIRRHVL